MSKRAISQYGSKKALNYVWNVAKTVPGKDPKLYRQDNYGNVAYKYSYGKDSPMGWSVDHIKPVSKGGSDSVRNLQLMNTTKNKSLGNTLVKKSRHSKCNK